MNICSVHLKLKKMSNICGFDNFEKLKLKTPELRTWMTLKEMREFGNAFERRESKCCGVLMKHRRKVKGEQVITLEKY